MQIVSSGDNFHEMSKPFFSGKSKKKKIQYVICESFTEC